MKWKVFLEKKNMMTTNYKVFFKKWDNFLKFKSNGKSF